METKINYDCRYFYGDIPCKPHKEKGIHCEGCSYYNPVKERILIIKLDSIGDVLRTTSILSGLREKYPHSQITWITRAESIPLFENNFLVDRVLDLSAAPFILATDDFDIVINLDAAPLSSRLATIARGQIKKGFGYDTKGFVYPFNTEAELWFLMSIFDDIKKANKRTYQSIMFEICGLNPLEYSIQYFLKPEEIEFANRFAELNGLKSDDIVIGLNTGAGGRWEKKKWTEKGFIELINMIRMRWPEIKILLYGGPEEVERNRFVISKTANSVIDAGCKNSIRNFVALLNLSSLVVTGDTLALHLAAAMKKKIIALIGPTSASELDLYGRGIKITADLPCLYCYRPKCDKNIDCMSSIHPSQVLKAIENLL